MEATACYRLLLLLYPADFRRRFADEMLCVFQQRLRERLSTRKIDSQAFVVREMFGLLKGAQTMWIEKILPIQPRRWTDVAMPESALSVAEVRKLRDEAISRMVQAIAT